MRTIIVEYCALLCTLTWDVGAFLRSFVSDLSLTEKNCCSLFLCPIIQPLRVTNLWDYKTTVFPTAVLQHHRNGINSTQPDLGDWVKSNVANM